MSKSNLSLMVGLIVLISGVGHWSSGAETAEGPLAKYVAAEDASYRWVKRHAGTLGTASYVELTLTSQTWRGTMWKHQLFIVKPSSLDPETNHGLLVVAGGSWKPELEKPNRDFRLPAEALIFAEFAEELRTPVAVLLQVPMQPLFQGKYEDAIIALTFEEFLKTGDATWPLLLPMVKSAVRGLDAIQECAQQEWSQEIDSFTVTGASKRGWTTWLTGAVDPRVTAIAPMVIDTLRFGTQLKHQKQSWGQLSYKIADYTERGLQKKLDTEAGHALQAIVDPYHYRHLLTQSKLIIIGTNDHYWTLDALNLYWDDLVGPKYILYLPNNRHSLRDITRIRGTLGAFHRHAAHGTPLAEVDWNFTALDETISLRVKADARPKEVRAWVATAMTRDFRNAKWQKRPSRADGEANVCDVAIPQAGYVAMFGEAVFEEDGLPYYLSTNVRIARQDEPPAR